MIRSEKILLLGLGGMGEYLARRLTHEGHQVTVIERDRSRIDHADFDLDARVIHGDAMDLGAWNKARASGMDYVVAVTNDDATNLLSCIVADRLGVAAKIARSRRINAWSEGSHLEASSLNIDLLIRPAELAAREIVRVVTLRTENVSLDVADGKLQVLATDVDAASSLRGLSVAELSARFSDLDFRVGCVTRDIDTFIPDGAFRIEQGDRVFLILAKGNAAALREFVQGERDSRHNVLIVGGGMVGRRVAELLQPDFHVVLLEKNEERAEELAHDLTKTTCLHGDGSIRGTLLQSGLLAMDTVITATGDDEHNVMTSLLAKHLIATRGDASHASEGRTIALLDREEYLVLAPNLGTDAAISRKVLAANQVLRHIRRGQILSVGHLHGCAAEVVELIARPESPITKKPVSEQEKLRDKVTVGAVLRNGKWQVALGSTQVYANERVICVCLEKDLGVLQHLFLS